MPNRVLSLTPITAALLAPLAASALSTALPPRSVTVVTTLPPPVVMCGNEPMPALAEPYKMVCATDQAVIADSGVDQGDNIRRALERLVDSQTGLFFPRGRYIVSGDLPLRSGNVLVGSPSGVTHFVNPSEKTSSIGQTLHSATNILVEGLVLDNIAINFIHAGTSVVRYNGLRGTTSELAQIWTHGGDEIVGNVLWREPAHPGLGIAAYGGRGARISGNLLGNGDAGPNAAMKRTTGPDARTRRLAEQMATLAAGNGTVPAAGLPRGHFTTALHVHGTTKTWINRNDITVAGPHVNDTHPAHPMAMLTNAQRLILMNNRFVVEGDAATALVPLVVQAPQSMHITGNTLVRVPLQLASDPAGMRPTKRTEVNENRLVGATISITQPVTGDDESRTTIDDLRFLRNAFQNVDRSSCMISAPEPSQPGRTFGERDNRVFLGGQPAKTCNLRDLPPQLSPVTPVTPLTPMKPMKPAIVASENGLPPTTITPAPGDGNGTASMPEVVKPSIPTTAPREPEAPRKRRWYKQASKFIEEKSDEIIDRLRAMIQRL